MNLLCLYTGPSSKVSLAKAMEDNNCRLELVLQKSNEALFAVLVVSTTSRGRIGSDAQTKRTTDEEEIIDVGTKHGRRCGARKRTKKVFYPSARKKKTGSIPNKKQKTGTSSSSTTQKTASYSSLFWRRTASILQATTMTVFSCIHFLRSSMGFYGHVMKKRKLSSNLLLSANIGALILSTKISVQLCLLSR